MYEIDVHNEHPAVAALVAAIKHARDAHAAAFHPGTDYFQPNELVALNPTRWAARIEALFDKPAEMARMKIERRELLISCESALLLAETKLIAAAQAERALECAIEEAVKAVDAITNSTPDRWLKDVLQTNIVYARRGICAPSCPFMPHRPTPLSEPIAEETTPAARAAFTVLADMLPSLPVRNCCRDFAGHSFVNLYPLEPACSAAALGLPRNRWHDEARGLHTVPLVGGMEAELPAVARLLALYDLLVEARAKAFEAAETLKQREKGSINERQYEQRLVRSLDTGGANVKDERDAQHARRLNYQSARLALRSAVIAAEGIRIEMVPALKAAVAEAIAFETAGLATPARQLAFRTAVVDCLEADRFIRFAGNDFKDLHAQWVEDMSGGKGQEALEREYHDIARQLKQKAAQS